MLLPYEWINLFYAIQHPNEAINDPISWTYFRKMMEYAVAPSFWDTAIGNLTNGKKAVMIWNWEKGRFFTILALFLFGYVMGKRNLFEWNEKTRSFWKKTFLISIVAFIPLYLIKLQMNDLIASDIIRRSAATIETTWTNFSFMVVLLSGITLLFYKTKLKKSLMYFSPFGRMSLSNYIIQSIIGGFVFYGWGLGLYKYTGATYGIIIGLLLTFLLGKFCKWWAKNHKQGPFETVWHKATWFRI